MTTTNAAPKCQYCGSFPHQGLCPQIKAIEYHQDGTVRRVELMTPKDYPVTISAADTVRAMKSKESA